MTAPAEEFLATACPTCQDPVGEHTVRLWTEHQVTDVPFTKVPVGEMDVPVNAPMADLVDVRAMLAQGVTVGFGAIAAVELHFQMAALASPNMSVARAVFVGPPRVMRQAGQLIRAAANRAADVAEGKTR